MQTIKLLIAAVIASALIGCGATGGEDTAGATEEIVIDQSDIDDLGTGQTLALRLDDGVRYTFDVTQGPIDFHRVRLTMDEHEVTAVDDLLERRPASAAIPERGEVDAVSISVDPAALQVASATSDHPPTLSMTQEKNCNQFWRIFYCSGDETVTVCVTMSGYVAVPC